MENIDHSQQIIDQTKKWINDVVIQCNFCPFAATVMKQQQVHYAVETSSAINTCMEAFLQEITRLDNEINIETIFLIFPNTFEALDDYLDMVSLAEKLLKRQGYEGIYQLASFHPFYKFADSTESDAANYTNRSIYPMLHLLRESSIDKALEHYKDPENIPDRNIDFARKKGLEYMKMLRDTCMKG
ncbi:MAG: DUF1415 domain-containing protein [Ferruginibacter sp.]